MKKVYTTILIIIFVIIGVFYFYQEIHEDLISLKEFEETINQKAIELPIERAKERITKKPFGIKISPQTSPVQPEKFSGYHTGIDYEIFEGEENINIQVFAICDGKLLKKERVSGYGGLLVQECELNNQSATVIYGHIKLSSVQQDLGDQIFKGNKLALLGGGSSQETDYERKHLHLGIHKGREINVQGYVQTEIELKGWINYESLINP